MRLMRRSYAVVLVAQDDPSSPVVRWLLVRAPRWSVGVLISSHPRAPATPHGGAARERGAHAGHRPGGSRRVRADRDGRHGVCVEPRGGAHVRGVRGGGRGPAGGRRDHLARTGGPSRSGCAQRRRRPTTRPLRGERSREAEGRHRRCRRGHAEPWWPSTTEHILLVFMSDVSPAPQREREREELMREQAAREEAEQMAEHRPRAAGAARRRAGPRPAGGHAQALLSAAVRGAVSAEAAAILLPEEDGRTGRARLQRGSRREPPRADPARASPARVARLARSPSCVNDPPDADVSTPRFTTAARCLGVPLLAGEDGDRRDPRGRAPAAALHRRRPAASRAWPPTGWRWPSTTRGSSSASTGSPRPSSAACCPTGCRRCPGLEVAARYLPGRQRGRGGWRLVRRDPHRRAAGWAW